MSWTRVSLIAAAREAAGGAYAPYSNFHVGAALGFADGAVRVIARDVGGSFGLKSHPWREEAAVVSAALLYGRPLKWAEDRYENLIGANQAREQEMTLTLAFDEQGRLLGSYADGAINNGAYPTVADANVATVTSAIEALGLSTTTSALRAGLIACTGKTGCRFAAAHTKESADEIAAWCDERVSLTTPVNIHLTGCHHSCAQHYIGDIGMIGARVPVNDDGDTVDGFHLLVGGGFGTDATMARELFQNVKAEDAPRTVERVLKAYLNNRASDDETFITFARRNDIEALKRMTEMEAV